MYRFHIDIWQSKQNLHCRLFFRPYAKSNIDRLSSMSKAAQKLIGSTFRGDATLRSAYTPSSSNRSSKSNTPYRTPHKSLTSPFNTPKHKTPTPKHIKSPSVTKTPTNLTDNLLNLPKRKPRPVAADFF